MASWPYTKPMTSAMATRVEKASSHLLATPDWTLNMEICDLINADQGKAKDVVKTIKKRLQSKKTKVQFFALTLLETLIKNCGDYLHHQVVEQDIPQDMTKIVKKGRDMQVRDKALLLLDSWQEAFGGPGGKYPQFYQAYMELKKAGVALPQRMADTPIFTPPAKHPALISSNSVRLDEAMSSEKGIFSLSDLNQIQNVMEVLADMLRAINPQDHEGTEDEVITELVSQCRFNQKRLMEHLSSTGDEEILEQGLILNDTLQRLLAKHDAILSGAPLLIEASKNSLKQKTSIEQPVVRNQLDENDEKGDEFSQLGMRKTKLKQVSSDSSSLNSSDPLSPHNGDITTTSTLEASSSSSNALVLLDPPAPVRTHKEEQNLIDLWSLTLTSNPSPPHTPHTPPRGMSQQEFPSLGQGSSNTSQSCSANQGYTLYNDYVAPWAQHALPPPQPQAPMQQPFQYTNNHAIPPSAFNANFNSLQSSYQYPAYPYSSNSNSFAGYTANLPQYYNSSSSVAGIVPNAPAADYLPDYSTGPTQQYGSFGSGVTYVPTSIPGANQPNCSCQLQQSNNSFSSGAPVTTAIFMNHPNFASQPQQNYNSFGSRVATTPTATTNQPINPAIDMQNYNSFLARNIPTASLEQQMKGNSLETGTSLQKPYYHPDSLFSDLIDMRSSGAGQRRPLLSGASDQSMINESKSQ